MTDRDALTRLIRTRRSVRRFTDRPVERALINDLVEAAQWAPSAGNRQDWLFTVVTAEAAKTGLAEATCARWETLCTSLGESGVADELRAYARYFDWFDRAPVVVVVSCRKPEAYLRELLGEEAAVVSGSRASAAMAAQNFMLAAHAAGLATCCLTGPLAAGEKISALLNLESRREIVCLVAMGYPAETPAAPARPPAEKRMAVVE